MRIATFVLVVLRLVNVVQQLGMFWITNNFSWGWLLVPVLAPGELIKWDTAASAQAVSTHTPGYLNTVSAFVVGWLATMPLWQGFLRTVVGGAEAEAVFGLSLLSVGCYVLFAFNNVADSVFYGRGRSRPDANRREPPGTRRTHGSAGWRPVSPVWQT